MSMKTLQIYRPGRFRRFGLAAVMLRLLASVLGHWWVYLLVAFLLFPNGPHVLVRNAHVEHGVLQGCTYIGSRGLVETPRHAACPRLVMLKQDGTRMFQP